MNTYIGGSYSEIDTILVNLYKILATKQADVNF